MSAIPIARRRAIGRSLAHRVGTHVEQRCRVRETDSPDRGETPAQRADRNLNELLQELRVAQTGVQLLFGFLLAIAFQARFTDVGQPQRILYVVTLVCCTAAFALLVAPVATHRALFQRRMKMVVVIVSHYLTMAGLSAMVLAVIGCVVLAVWEALGLAPAIAVGSGCFAALLVLWVALPSVLRRHLGTEGEEEAESEPAGALVSHWEQPAADDAPVIVPGRR